MSDHSFLPTPALPSPADIAPIAAAALVAIVAGAASPGAALALDKVVFGTNWSAEAEHGGFYQAVAAGLYEKRGLEVEIRPGGPQVNNALLLAAGELDFNIGSNGFENLNYVASGVPVVAVASMFQKDPQVLLAHPGQGNDTLEAMVGKPVMIGAAARETYWKWLEAEYGFTEDQIRRYTFNVAPFLVDAEAIQQGYVTAEPYAIRTQGGFDPVAILLADHGYDSYSTTIQTTQGLIDRNPDLVQRFVDASIEGWYGYLYGDPSAADALIKADNPEMTDEQLAYSRQAMIDHGIVDSGDAKELGIGAMTDRRWQDFFAFASGAGLYPADLDWRRAYTLRFVNRRVGL